jgi:hypothetical protein
MKNKRADHFYLFIVLSFAIVIVSSCCSINNINQTNKDAQKMGVWITSDTLQVVTLCYYRRGKLQGKYTSFFPNGVQAVSGHYKKGQKKGVWKYKISDGQIMAIERYRKGILIDRTMNNIRF